MLLKRKKIKKISRRKKFEFNGDIYLRCLGSSSRGNAHVVITQDETFLIDCGLGINYMEENMSNIGLSLQDVGLCLITHAHNDHWNKSMFRYFYENDIAILTNIGVARYLRKDKGGGQQGNQCDCREIRIIICSTTPSKKLAAYQYELFNSRNVNKNSISTCQHSPDSASHVLKVLDSVILHRVNNEHRQ